MYVLTAKLNFPIKSTMEYIDFTWKYAWTWNGPEQHLKPHG